MELGDQEGHFKTTKFLDLQRERFGVQLLKKVRIAPSLNLLCLGGNQAGEGSGGVGGGAGVGAGAGAGSCGGWINGCSLSILC